MSAQEPRTPMGRHRRRAVPAQRVLSHRAQRRCLLAGRSRWWTLPLERRQHGDASTRTRSATASAFPMPKPVGPNTAASSAWRAAAAARLKGWGFNTLGSWSDEAVAGAGTVLALTPNLDLGMSFAWAQERPQSKRTAPAFSRRVRSRVRGACAGEGARTVHAASRAGEHRRLVHRQRIALGPRLARAGGTAAAVSCAVAGDARPRCRAGIPARAARQ